MNIKSFSNFLQLHKNIQEIPSAKSKSKKHNNKPFHGCNLSISPKRCYSNNAKTNPLSPQFKGKNIC